MEAGRRAATRPSPARQAALEAIRALVRARPCGRRRRHSGRTQEHRAAGRPGGRAHHRAAAASACGRCWCARRARLLAPTRPHAHIQAAAFIEFIHTATLLHDDVVDMSALRRGRDTANEVFGNQASVLVGDFVYSRAFQMMAAVRSQRVIEIMAEATNVIAEGEVLQLMNARDPDTTEQRYLEVIHRKTAKLFQAGAEVAAVVSGRRSHGAAGAGALSASISARPTS